MPMTVDYQGRQVSAVSGINQFKPSWQKQISVKVFYQNILSAAISQTNPLTFYRTDSVGKYSDRINVRLC